MADFRVVILSRDAGNAVPCVQAVLKHEPDLPHERIVVVDDGARAGAESKLPGITWLDGVKPFIFSRNANIGLMTPIEGAYQDTILLNDDAELGNKHGFTLLSEVAATHPEYGIISAAIVGDVGNPRQKPQGQSLREEHGTACFIAIYIPLRALQIVGPLDETYAGYGWEDNDYCHRVRLANLKVGIYDGCLVRHGRLPSSYRSGGHCSLEPNRAVFNAKWGICA